MSVMKSSTVRANSAPAVNLNAHDSHSVQFYSDDAFLVDGLCRFIGSALTSGNSAIVIATPEHRNALAVRLKTWGLESAVAQGRYIALDAQETLSTFMVEGFPDARSFEKQIGKILQRARLAARGDNPSIAAFGEMVALL